MTQRETELEHELSAALIKVDDQRELLRLAKEENEEKRLDIVWTMGERAKLMDRVKQLEEENNELRAEEARLLNTNGELERRIKRLIDAGDAMFPWSERVGQEFWTKAKEAK
jgi:predicted RNase H-like nuclease (RuvC/YqgF family)